MRIMEILTEMENVWHEAEWSTELILDRSECKSLFELKLFSPFVVFFFVIFGFQFLVFGDFGFHLCKCVFLF